LVMHYGPAADLVMQFGQLHRMKPYSKNLWRFPLCGPHRNIWLCGIGHCTEFGYSLWATAQDVVMRFGPKCRIFLCTTGRPQCRIWLCPITITQNHNNFFEKLAKFFKGTVRLKSDVNI
jgi:hypothetical protein